MIYSNSAERIGHRFSREWAPDMDIVYQKTISLSGLQVIGSVSDYKLQQKTADLVRQSILLTVCGILLIIVVIIILHHHY